MCETPATAWRVSFQGVMESLEAQVGDLLEPQRLQERRKYRQRPNDAIWLTSLLSNFRRARHLLRWGGETGAATEEDRHQLLQAQEVARQGAQQNLSWVKAQMQRESADLVSPYRSLGWIEAIEAGLPGEMWYHLAKRDAMEAHIRAPEWLHPDLVPGAQFAQVVRQIDARLREEGPRLWRIEAPTGYEPEQRASFYPREDWWWWLDQSGGEGTAAT